MVKVLLITSKGPIAVADSIAPSLGLYRIRHHLRKRNIDCDVFDLQLYKVNICISNVERGVYDIVGIGVTHWNMVSDLEFLWQLKNAAVKSGKKCLFVAGGHSATQNAKQWLDCGFDLIVLGYGETVMQKSCEQYAHRKSKSIYRLFYNLDGIALLDKNRKLVFNPSPPLSQTEFEYLSFTLDMEMELPYNEYWNHIRQRTSKALEINKRSYVVENARLYTSNLCLAKCGYCSSENFLRTAQQSNVSFYMLSASQVHKLIKHHVNKYGASAFSINDQDFLLGNKVGINRIIKLCELIVESKQNGEIPEKTKFSCQTRISDFFTRDTNRNKVVNYKLIDVMAKARFHNVSLGVETFSNRLLKCPSVNKGFINTNDINTVLSALIEYGLFPTINLIIGIPESTSDDIIETIKKTMNYLEKPCQISVVKEMLAFPGAPIWNSKEYPTTYKTWVNPESKQMVSIPYYFIPREEKISSLISQLGKASNDELENMKNANSWNNSKLIPRTAVALSTFMAVAKILNDSCLMQRIKNVEKRLVS